MRSNFIISALAGIAAANYQQFKVNVDGSVKKYFVESKDFSTVEMVNDDFIMNGRPSSLSKDIPSMGFNGMFGDGSNVDRLSSTSLRWQSNMMP